MFSGHKVAIWIAICIGDGGIVVGLGKILGKIRVYLEKLIYAYLMA